VLAQHFFVHFGQARIGRLLSPDAEAGREGPPHPSPTGALSGPYGSIPSACIAPMIQP
jgi:hypothetical protein